MSQTFSLKRKFSIRYELKFDVKVHGLFTDFTVTVPVIVGTESTSTEQEQRYPQQRQRMDNSIGMPITSGLVFERGTSHLRT